MILLDFVPKLRENFSSYRRDPIREPKGQTPMKTGAKLSGKRTVTII
jgi:hypothetical protein